MQPLKHPEQLVHVLHVESHAVVPDVDDRFVGLTGDGINLDLRPGPAPRIFRGVVEQVRKDLAQHRRIALDLRQRAHRPVDVRRLRPHVLERVADDGVEAHALEAERRASISREREQIVNQPLHAAGLAGNRLEMPGLLGIEARHRGLFEQSGKAGNAPERRTQVVRDRIRERLELLVDERKFANLVLEERPRFFKTDRPLFDARFQVVVCLGNPVRHRC